jgi:FkbH-like protein
MANSPTSGLPAVPLVPFDSLLEPYLAAGSDAAAFAVLTRGLKQLVETGRYEDAAAVIRKVAGPGLDYTSIQALGRALRRCRGHCAPAAQTAKLAVLSSFTSTQLVEMIELFLFAGGVDLELYEADYGVLRQEVLDPDSGLYRFRPALLLIATTWRDLTHGPALDADADAVGRHVAAEQAEWSALWQTAHQRLGCQIIQNNFDRPYWRQLGNHEMRHAASQGQFITRVNQALQTVAPPYVTIHDLDSLSAGVGRRIWGDERFFHHAKMPCAPECLGDYAHSVASILLAQMGLSKKCLVLDLDNTLWGGVIGDDGLGGIRLGQGDAEGEGFLAFQRYTQKLRQRGVILAVCSKNTDAVAREVFLKHPEMVLTLDDIACFVANWEDKASNIRAIAAQLNIGINSLVFLDDNPAERAIVRRLVPEVAVPEVSGDPLDFIRALEEYRYFQVVLLGREDLQRTEYYRNNTQRQQVEASAENLDEFLKSLQMTATVGPITDLTLERSTQLINKSNQFNLTTIRRSAAEVQAIAHDPNYLTRTVALKDRFGDNGLISVLLAKIEGEALDIDTWLMSCRVLKRNVERFLLDHLCGLAAARGLRVLRGRYLPTPKNALVKDHYPNLGFRLVRSDAERRYEYELALADWKPTETFIQIRETL